MQINPIAPHPDTHKESAMLKFLLPVDGSETSTRAVTEFVRLTNWYKEVPEIHLLNVQLPQRGNVPLFIDRETIDLYYREEGMRELATACKILKEAEIGYSCHIVAGTPHDMILRYAGESGCNQIVMGPRGLGTVKGILLGSVASKVIQLATVPVLLIK